MTSNPTMTDLIRAAFGKPVERAEPADPARITGDADGGAIGREPVVPPRPEPNPLERLFRNRHENGDY